MADNPSEQDLRDAIRESIAERLRPICAEWPAEVFDDMVARLALLTVKYDVGSGGAYDRRSTDRLVAELRELMSRSQELRNRLATPSSTDAQASPAQDPPTP